MKNNKYLLALSLIFSLFFIWAISSNLLPSMIKQLMKTFELSSFQASLTESSYWIAYFIFPIPIAMFMKRFGYKSGIVTGLAISALGALLFFPAAMLQQYWAYLLIFFIIATGMCFLETAANPYVSVLGDEASAPRRLNLAQSFNGLGAFIAAMFLSKIVLDGSDYSRETLPADYPGGWDGFIANATDSMKMPYLILAIVLIAVASVIAFTKLPKIGDEAEGSGSADSKLIDFSVLKRSHLRKGVIAQFFYNGGQTSVNAFFMIYCCKIAGMQENASDTWFDATTMFGFYMLAFLVGRWVGTLLMGKYRPQDMLWVYAVINVVLCAVVIFVGGVAGVFAMLGIAFFMSIMYPTQFSLALTGLGNKTKSASAFLVMAIVGNVILPPLTGLLLDRIATWAYIIPLVSFAACAYYGKSGYKVID